MDDLQRLITTVPRAKDWFDLNGKNAVVIGGNKGLGQAMAIGLAGAGANIAIVGRGPEGLEETVEALKKLGSDSSYIAADVTIEEKVVKFVQTVIDRYGKIDILVNSQGTVHLEETDKFDVNKWQQVIDVNLKSVFLCCKYFGPKMVDQGWGRIINISSVRGFQGRANDPAYAPSKGAVNQLTRSLAIEWGAQGVNVNGIAPVFTLTKMSESFISNPQKKEWVLSRIPMKRLGQLEDLIGPVVFLASEASRFVNGHILPVDGGWLAA